MVDGYLGGDTDAVAVIDNYIDGAFSVWRHRFGYETDDIKSDVRFKLIKSLRDGQFEYRSALKTFISRIVSHTCIDYLRFSRRFSPDDISDMDLESANESVELAMEKRQFGRLLFRVLRQLPRKCIELWRMHMKEGLRCREIGDRLGKTEGNVRRQLWECRTKAREIRELLEKRDKPL